MFCSVLEYKFPLDDQDMHSTPPGPIELPNLVHPKGSNDQPLGQLKVVRRSIQNTLNHYIEKLKDNFKIGVIRDPLLLVVFLKTALDMAKNSKSYKFWAAFSYLLEDGKSLPIKSLISVCSDRLILTRVFPVNEAIAETIEDLPTPGLPSSKSAVEFFN